MRKIVTSHVYPPIPDRQFDWCAYFDGEKEAGSYGYGATEAEAVADFVANCVEADSVSTAESFRLLDAWQQRKAATPTAELDRRNGRAA